MESVKVPRDERRLISTVYGRQYVNLKSVLDTSMTNLRTEMMSFQK